MTGFIASSNLPQGRVKSVICGELCDELNDFLDKRGIERLVIRPNNYIDSAVRYHADMTAIHLGHGLILIDENQNILGELLREKGFDVRFTAEPIKGEYPQDIKLNFTLLNGKIIGKLLCADQTLLTMTEAMKKINVKQGYCKCSCLVVNKNAIITDDESIYKNAVRNDIDCLLISKGDVLLPGHEYGFIGGASGKISKSEVLFFGDIVRHRDYKKIAAFIQKHGCEIISLDFQLTDFGGIIPITEETP